MYAVGACQSIGNVCLLRGRGVCGRVKGGGEGDDEGGSCVRVYVSVFVKFPKSQLFEGAAVDSVDIL